MALRASSARGLTLAARVLGGFLLALSSFAVVSGYGVSKLDRFQRDLARVADTYVKLRVAVTRIQSEHGELTLAASVTLPPTFAHVLRDARGLELADIRAAEVNARGALGAALPADEAAFLADLANRLAGLRRLCDQTAPLLEAALEPGADDAARATLGAALRREKAIITRLDQSLAERIDASALRLRREEIAALRRSIALTAAVLLLGLGLALSAHLALRRLGRLGASAREIAHGDYRQRVDERGPSDVAELAQEFNKMAAALEEREQRLIRSERLATVGRVAAQITHEVRNPLSSIGLNAELLEEEVGKLGDAGAAAEARALCRAITKEVDRLATITEEYLRLARMPRPQLEREELNPLVTSLLDFLRGELAAARIDVEARLGEALPAVAADENQLRQALLNLLRNAREAMPGGGTLTVETRRAPAVANGAAAGGAAVEIVVRDTGPGIAPDHIGHIFEPFFSTKDGGTGLGLALTQQIVSDHGGQVTVESATGGGATFTVRLPAAG